MQRSRRAVHSCPIEIICFPNELIEDSDCGNVCFDLQSQMEESSDNTMHKPGQSSHYQGANQQQGGNQQQQGGNQHMSEAARNKARQGSSLTFGNDDSASDSAAHNKYGQTHRSKSCLSLNYVPRRG